MLFFERASLARLALSSVPVLLAACGGGGSGGDGTTATPPTLVSPASLTPAQAQLLAGRAAMAANQGATASQLSQIMLSLATTSAPTSGTQSCGLSGSASYTRLDADGNNLVSAGDSITLIGSQCKFSTNGVAGGLDGQLSALVTQASGGASTSYYTTGTSWLLKTVQSYTALTSTVNGASVKLGGTVEVMDTATNNSYRFDKFSAVGGSGVNTLLTSGTVAAATISGATDGAVRNLTLTDLSLQTNYAGSDKVAITLPTASQKPLRFNSAGQVVGGTLTLQLDKVKVVVTVTATNQARVDVDNNNDGSIDATQSVAWTSLLSGAAL